MLPRARRYAGIPMASTMPLPALAERLLHSSERRPTALPWKLLPSMRACKPGATRVREHCYSRQHSSMRQGRDPALHGATRAGVAVLSAVAVATIAGSAYGQKARDELPIPSSPEQDLTAIQRTFRTTVSAPSTRCA